MSIIIIKRPYAFLEKEMKSFFQGDEGTKIIIDRRNGDRRKKQIPIDTERRKGDNRRTNINMLEVIMTL